MTALPELPSLKWSVQLDVLPAASTPLLKGDKIVLPPSALEQLLSAATVTTNRAARPQTSSFDPYNPYSFEAERQAREQVIERQQQLPHPLTFRLVNPANGRVTFAGIREFSAGDNAVGLSPFLRSSLGIGGQKHADGDTDTGRLPNGHGLTVHDSNESSPRLTVHVQELPKGTYAKFRPLEPGYDPEDWKALLERYLRDTFTTLTTGEVLSIPAGKEVFRFLVDSLKPNQEAISLVDTDLEVDIEPLNEEQARETLQRLAQKSQRAPGTPEGSSSGGKLHADTNELGQVRPGEYVDYSVEHLGSTTDLELELTGIDDKRDLDLFLAPFSQKYRDRPREDAYVFGDLSTTVTKRLKIRHTNAELDNAEALWVSVHGYENAREDAVQETGPMRYNLRISHVDASSVAEKDDATKGDPPLGPDEECCTNCRQPVPKRTMFLHQNFCLRNNILCTHCKNVFQKSSPAWSNHWHCPQDESYGSTPSSHTKHDILIHTTRNCPSCDYEAANTPDLAHHRTTTCPGKLILCQFCHLQVPQQGPDDPSPGSAEVILSGLTPHERTDGARTTECHLCSKITRLRDMVTHLKHHDMQRLTRPKARICRNENCGKTLDGMGKNGEVRWHPARNELGVCDTCFGPLYVSMYDPEGKALRRRVERKYLTQLLTGCGSAWCRNDYCKSGRKHLGLETEVQTMTSKDALAMIKPVLERLKNGMTNVQFCTDEAIQKRRVLAEMMAAESTNSEGTQKGKGKDREGMGSGYAVEWCVAALEVEGGDLDKARLWLKGFAPTRAEETR